MIKSLYIHIPFCKSFCPYCDFVKQYYCKDLANKYIDLIIKKLNHQYKNNKFETIYIGGGTPNCLNQNQLKKLLFPLSKKLKTKYEFTIECNPEFVNDQQIKIFKKYKINRISLGIQTLDKQILSTINRTNHKKNVEKAIKIIFKHKLTNLSCDLIYGFNNQTINSIKNDIDFLLEKKVKHLSCYCLEIKPMTMFALKKYKTNDLVIEKQLAFIIKYLKTKKFKRYEVSNWCLNQKYQAKHNILIWKTNEWAAIGYGAYGYENNKYYHYDGNLLQWKLVSSNLTKKDLYQQILIMGLRLIEGISLKNKLVKQAYTFFKKQLLSSNLFVKNKNNIKCKNINLLNLLLEKII